MKQLRVALAGIAAAATVAQAALAADLNGPSRRSIKDEPIPNAVSFSWTGLYVGAHAGYGWSDVDWQETPAFSGSHDGNGWLAGVQIGYNLQAGRLVYGVEADLATTWIEGSNSCCGHSVNWLASVRGRAGLTSADNRWLFYVTGGGAWADVEYSGAGFGTFSDAHFGWVAGAGIERALTPNLTAKVEYLYYDFDKVSAPAGAVGPGPADLDPTLQTVRFGLNLKF